MKVLGIDEAGRGPVIGPMVMVGFLIEEELIPRLKEIGVKDSKLLSPETREKLDPKIREMGQVFIRVIEPHQIDGFNLNRLEMMAARDIINQSGAGKVIIDAFEKNLKNKLGVGVEVIAEPKADLNYEIVGAASIVAKVLRDKKIEELREKYGDLGSGYPGDPKTAEYIDAMMKSKGELPHFVRRSWGTIKRIEERQTQSPLTSFLKD